MSDARSGDVVDAARAARTAALLSAASLLGIVPHVIEDALTRTPQKFGLSVEQGLWLFGFFVAAQLVAAVLAMAGSRLAALAVVAIALVWVVAAVADHIGAFAPGDFRRGFSSRVWVWLLVGLQAATGVAGARAFALVGRLPPSRRREPAAS